ncbi:hypothetical protein M9458_041523, partial [Cirrhinus mrigala]
RPLQPHHGLFHQPALKLQQLLWNLLLLSSKHGFSCETEERVRSCRSAPVLTSTYMHQHQWERSP